MINKIFTKKFFEIFLISIVSGMPFSIIITAITAFLKDIEISLNVITSFVIARIFYSLKPLWSPFVEFVSIPILYKIGHRKSWMIVTCFSQVIILLIISELSPIVMSTQGNNMEISGGLNILHLKNNPFSIKGLKYLAIILGFLSATFDISCDAFRIEKLNINEQSIGAACNVFGYRIGILITGSGSLFLAQNYGWPNTFLFFSILFFISTILIFFLQENHINRPLLDKIEKIKSSQKGNNLLEQYKKIIPIVLNPFKDFFKKDKIIFLLSLIMLFKLGEAMLAVVALPFYMEIGFSKLEIASVVKIYGVIATIIGSYVGGVLIYKLGYFNGLMLTAAFQAITNTIFIWLHHNYTIGINALLVTISMENMGTGAGSSALVAYMSRLCNKKYSAAQFALLSSIATFFNNSITIFGGVLVEKMGWDMFFIFTVILCLPAIIILIYLHKKSAIN